MGKDDEDFREMDELIDELGRDAGKPVARQLVATEGYAGDISAAADSVVAPQDESEDVGDRPAGGARDVDVEGRSDPIRKDRDWSLRGAGEGRGASLSEGMDGMDLFGTHARAMTPLQRRAWMGSAAFPDPCGSAGDRDQTGADIAPTKEADPNAGGG